MGSNGDNPSASPVSEDILPLSLYKALFNHMSSGVGIYAYDEALQDFIIKDVNPAVENIEHVSREEILGKRLTAIFPGIKEFGLLEVLHRVRLSGNPEHFSLALYQDDRVSGWKENYVFKLPSGEVVAMYDDVTEKMRVGMALAKNHKELEHKTLELETANRELEAFTSRVSHDLRAPLRHISSFSSILMDTHHGQLDDKGRHYLEIIHSSIKHMSELIDDLLKLSRVIHAQLQRVSFDLCVLAREVIAELRSAQPERQVEFICPGTLMVEGDLNLIRIVLQNIIGNAWKFTAGKPNPVVELGRKEASGNNSAILYVKDNGAGFDMRYADKLFIPFERLHTVAEFPGSGVGLAMVERIINRHGGKIWAESRVGEGATFYFHF